ncbi:hypothetical protein IAG44_24460 [Streptomyces roseirectus]|uniref:Uncharacterized protein n=1 Tax=Streptomyces roseirectus TaxID=2768066 RepID=A0A7H0IHJ0_9ACTN|nr:hypothetical protein [Streptomyces roseirectus]QNP72256.1 hypothetical protein IAG44_24460 [Streptomyces roseirectus]
MTGTAGGYQYSTPPPVAQRRLEAGWLQRIAWTVPVWGTFSLFAWIPFFYVAIRRGLPSDWGAFISFSVYEAAVWTWVIFIDGETGENAFSVALLLGMAMGSALLLFAVFDPKSARPRAPYAAPPQPNPYQSGPPYGH